MSDPVSYEQSAGVATITLNRPDVLNALNDALLSALGAAVSRAADDPTIRAVLMTGAGRGFCAGADLAAGAAAAAQGRRRTSGETLRTFYHPTILRIREMPKPVITAVNGVAAGAGMSLALCGDVVLAAESASFLQAFSRIGLIPDAGSTWLLPRLAGDSRARALALLAERISADDAHRFGLVWKVYPDATLMDEATRLAAHLATMPTRAFALIKQALNASAANTLETQLELEAELQTQAATSADFAEGVAAFLAKRAPRFSGN